MRRGQHPTLPRPDDHVRSHRHDGRLLLAVSVAQRQFIAQERLARHDIVIRTERTRMRWQLRQLRQLIGSSGNLTAISSPIMIKGL